jgi:hypothetical protein
MSISKTKRDKIVAQAIEELIFSRRYKQGKVKNWQKNEDLYYGKKDAPLESRANVDLGRMQEFVHTWLSKIDNPLIFKFTKRKLSQLKRVARLNALRKVDQDRDDWDIKDIAGKKQAAIYGRAVYWYSADSIAGYQPHLDNVDVYDFLIDPTGGGLDIEKARYMGRYGVVKDKTDLRKGQKEGLYIKSEVDNLIGGEGNALEINQEETNKRNRALDTNITRTQKESGATTDKYKFWEWLTTFEGERYYLLLNERGGTAIRVEELPDMFTPSEQFPLGAWPVWSWATCPDLTEFWTPSPCDYVREIFMAQGVSISQMLDNAEEINKPQVAIDTGAIDNLAQLKYRRQGQIHLKSGVDVTKALQFIRPPSIDTPIEVFNILEGIQQKASGVNAGTEGAEKTDAKVGIYEGNQAAAADRFGLLNKSYTFGYKRFARLYEIGIRDHLTKKVAIDLIGPDGVETEEITKRDIFHRGDTFNVIVEASDAEDQASTIDQKNKLQFLNDVSNNPNPAISGVQNPKKAYEIGAKVVGFNEDEIKQLLDTSEYGNAEIISECELDIEGLLEGKEVKPNKAANLAYKQHFVDYLVDHEDDMEHDQFMKLSGYLMSLEPIVMKNTARELAAKMAAMNIPPQGGAAPKSKPPVSGATGPVLPANPAPTPNGPGQGPAGTGQAVVQLPPPGGAQ